MSNGKVFIIDGVTFNVPIAELERKGDVLDLTATRTEDGKLHREIIGTYYNYSIKVAQTDFDKYDAFWQVVTAPQNHLVQLPHESAPKERYFGSCRDNIFFVTSDGYRANGFSCNCIAVNPDRTPAPTSESTGTNE